MNAVITVSPAVFAYRHAGVVIRTCGLLLALAFPLGLMASGMWRRLQQALHWAVGSQRMVLAAMSGAIYGLAWSLVSDGVQLALRLNRQRFGFEDQAWPSWLGERVGSTVMLVVLGLIAAPLGYALMVRSPERWPLWSALATAILLVSAVMVQPLLADTRPLPAGPLKAQINQMLRGAGHTDAPVVLRRDSGPCVGGTNLGMFPTTRIIIDDGYLNYPAAQGVEVTAHELGHYVRHDPELGVLAGLVWLLIGIGVLYRAIQAKGTAPTNVGSLAPIESPLIPTMIFWITLVYLAGLPLFNLIQRRIEHRADQYAMELTHDGPAGVAGMLRDLRCDHLDPTPGWWSRTFFWNHPSVAERVRFMSGFHPPPETKR